MKKAILLAAYGASSVEAAYSLQMFEQKVRSSFKDTSVRWAFTSPIVRDRMAVDKIKTDSVTKALCRMGFEKFTHVTVQSLHIIPGSEYSAMLDEIADASCPGAPEIRIGKPLLDTYENTQKVAEACMNSLPKSRRPDEPVLWMGHGSWHTGSVSYKHLAEAIHELDKNVYVGTLSGPSNLNSILPDLLNSNSSLVWLMPLLSVSGKHMASDLAGDKPESWKSILQQHGLKCNPVLRGAIEYEGFADIWLQHLQDSAW